MHIFTASDARANLFRLIDKTAEQHEPVLITGKRHNAVLLSEQDWKSVQETMYLLSIPGMRESVLQGLQTPEHELLGEAEFLAQLAEEEEGTGDQSP